MVSRLGLHLFMPIAKSIYWVTKWDNFSISEFLNVIAADGYGNILSGLRLRNLSKLLSLVSTFELTATLVTPQRVANASSYI